MRLAAAARRVVRDSTAQLDLDRLLEATVAAAREGFGVDDARVLLDTAEDVDSLDGLSALARSLAHGCWARQRALVVSPQRTAPGLLTADGHAALLAGLEEKGDTSLLLVHGRDGRVRAFHNVCTHRGNQVVQEGHGNCKGFQCNFHGWTYDTRGRLAFVTDEQRFHNLDKSALGLPPVHLDTWRGFVFVNLAKRPAQTLEMAMSEFNQDLKPFPFERMVLAGRYRYTVNANWKVTMNAFQESYHGAFVHKLSVGQCISPDDPYLAV